MIEEALKRGKTPPAHLLEGPEVEEAALPYWKAFWTLNGGRVSIPGFSYLVDQPIPVSEMDGYMRGRVGFDSELERDGFIEILQAMDRLYLDVIQADRATQAAVRGKRR